MSSTTQSDMPINSTSSSLSDPRSCSNSTGSVLMSYVCVFIHIFFLLPLSFHVLFQGLQRWRHQGSFATTSHSDILTYHSAAMELICGLGLGFYFCGLSVGLSELTTAGQYLYCIAFPGQTSIHVLTCVERYMAVVHPVIYVGLKQSGGVRIRNISIGCVWLMCFGWIGVTSLHYPNYPYTLYFCLLVFSLLVVSFCSLSVLCVLIRPGPGEMGVNREQADQSKQRAFYIITAILAVLLLCLIGYLVCLALVNSNVQNYIDWCVVLASGYLVTLPSSSVLPLLFLHRARKLVCCHCSNK